MYVQRRYAWRPIEIHILTYSKHEMSERKEEKKFANKKKYENNEIIRMKR